jgi:VRR-NUC domain
MTENALKRHVLQAAYAKGWAVYHVPQATMRNGGGAGYPDLTLARDREVLWIELKQEKGTLSPQQMAWHAALPFAHVIRPSDLWNGRLGELLA